jgi:hypothetical protein
MQKHLLVLAILLTPTLSLAKSYDIDGAKFSMPVKSGWQDPEDLFGMPLTILGPEQDGARPVITVTPTTVAPSFDSKKLADDREYKEGREAWLAKKGGKAIRYFPYAAEKWGKSVEVHSMGYEYTLNDHQFSEKTYFAMCKGKLFHLKSLIRQDQEKEFGEAVEATVRGFTCE